MASQYDHIAGLDLSSLSSVTQAQIMQAINQLGPLGNIGGIIYQAGTSLNATIAEGTGGAPDVTNNPRFARYLWLNSYSVASAPPTPYYYDASTGDWTSSSIAAGSITNTHINAAAAIAVTKLAAGTARYVLRTNAAGTAVEFIAPGSINTTNEIPVNNLVAGGSDGFLKTGSGAVAWVANAAVYSAVQSAISGLLASQITAGAPGTVLGAPVSGGVTAFGTARTVLGTLSLDLDMLKQESASTNDMLRWNGSQWAKVTPSLRLVAGDAANSGITVGTLGAATVFTQAHGLGSVPKIVRVVAVCTVIDVGWQVGDEIDVVSIRNAAGNNVAISIGADATNITFTLNSAAGNEIPNKGTGVFAAMTEASWDLKVYAWK